MTEDAMTAFYTALSAAQGEFKNPPKTKTAAIRSKKGEDSSYGYQYADLADVLDTVRPVLAKHKLGHVHIISPFEGKQTLTTRVFHAAGGYLESIAGLPQGLSAQELGSAITYLRRYSLSALLGLAAEADNDAAGVGPGKSDTDMQRDQLVELMSAASLGNKAVLDACRALGIDVGATCRTTEAVSDAAIAAICARWTEIVAKASEPPPGKKTPPAATTEAAAAPAKPEVKPAPEEDNVPFDVPTDYTGIPEAAAALMMEASITPAMLKKYAVAKGHQTADLEPASYPSDYYRTLTIPANWKKATAAMKAS